MSRARALLKVAVGVTRMVALNALAVLAFVLLALSPWPVAGYVLGAAAVALMAWRYRRNGLGKVVSVRVMLVCGVTAQYVGSTGPSDPSDVPLLLATAILIGLVMYESLIAKATSRAHVAVGNLPHFSIRTEPLLPAQTVFRADLALVLVFGVLTALGLPSWPLLVLALLVFAGAIWLLVDVRRLGKRREETWAELTRAVAEYGPRFVLHFSGPKGVLYQTAMWLPYLERLGVPFLVIVRERSLLEPVEEQTTAPVIHCPTIGSLETLLVPGLDTAFYVNNGMKNSHFVKFHQLTHVQLLHGDSDKAPSYNPVTTMYDRIFVAGQAGIDRYHKHDVPIPDRKFDVVGRPQVEDIEVRHTPIADVRDPVVLYAPTWRGYSDSVNYCSLPVAERIVAGLLERGATVVLRPHPFTRNDRESSRIVSHVEHLLAADTRATGRPHVYGSQATDELTIVDCFNRSDAMIADVSSVVTDYLYSQKPFAISDMMGDGSAFAEEFPLASVAYVLHGDGTGDGTGDVPNLAAALDDLLQRDPLAPARRAARTYYLGDFPEEHYADRFVEVARGYVTASSEQPAVGGTTVGA